MGALKGIRVLEVGGIGPGPFAGMLLSDMGADVVRVDRAKAVGRQLGKTDGLLNRGRRSIGLDLKSPGAVDVVLRMVDRADVLIEGFRPGVMERLKIGPDVCLERNPRLVFARMTGYGQDGPLSGDPGHDINYIAIAGALGAIGRSGDAPVPPLNLVGDFGGGAMLMLYGITCALLERVSSGRGQVVDAAMVDGAGLLMTNAYELRARGLWDGPRGENLLDTGAPHYEVYETRDGKFVAVGCAEPQFYARLIEGLGLDPRSLPKQSDRSQWPVMKERFREIFRTKTRDEWSAIFDGTEACVSPVLTLDEAPQNPHNRHRNRFVEVDGTLLPAPAPQLSRTPPEIAGPPPRVGAHTDEILEEIGMSALDVTRLRDSGVVA